MPWDLMNDYEFGSMQLLKLKYRRGDEIIQTFCIITSSEKSGPLSLIGKKFQDSEKNTPESCRMYWNLINDEEFGSAKLLKLKYRMGDQIIQTFCKIGCPRN